MNNEFADRQQAIKLRLAGQSVESLCRVLGRSPAWFHRWWRRYRALGPNGLFDLTPGSAQPRRIAPDLERTILTVRQRLTAPTHPGTRYNLIGASAILAELQALQIRPLPSLRTVERVLQRNGVTLPRVRLAPYLPRHTYPAQKSTSPINSIKWMASAPSTSRAIGNGITSSSAKTPTTALFA
jgi:transposase-like protein